MSDLALSQVTKSFGAVNVIKPLDLTAEAGEFVVFVGPSGCGKTTLLRMIAGLESSSGGEIKIGGREVSQLPPVERGVAMVFQSYALYPHMTVEDNIGFGLRIAGIDKAARKEKVAAAADVLRLTPYLHRKPKALSGGQRQRVAIGRAIVKQPDIFLFDEPLSNLDAELRVQMRLEIAKLHRELGATMIYVTHDQVEAMTLADKIVVLRDGRIEQVGRPIELYENPDNAFVAGFIGSPKMNFVEATVVAASGPTATVVAPALGPSPITTGLLRGSVSANEVVTLGFRPEHARIADEGIRGTVDLVERLGSVSYAYVVVEGGDRVAVEQRGGSDVRPGELVRVAVDSDRAMLFRQADGGRA